MASMNKTPSEEEIASTLTHLKISTKFPEKPAHKPKSKPVADSWDEEPSGSDTETEEAPKASSASAHGPLEPLSAVASLDFPPNPPPPTPASPPSFDFPDNAPFNARGRGDSGVGRSLDRRPDKTTAVAGRLIAGALGVRAPKRTDEEREYDRVTKEKERKRRAEEKERESREAEEREARKKAIWDA
ncbi:uncharacterized protein K460DRAFT_395976 [Cucurbitaria berberidis CBS 394.84]|uniref:Uncharacterized protein n=1 Tax=Cucurbitaria berberidis CBS 394.84 TaxID=1168544 RepID=A0A9P4GK81_9PLEO|nr:uncharacterized protein K460DRAFT_395976 [Cucurbitaria berberidis CBS 394.84]KAF1846625.1 hypothetical protein K460DRAFT_395976 [Cucurbitaria berberidis CBS 394.84]